MSKRGEPRPPPWSPKEVIKLRGYAARGFSTKEAGKCLGRSNRGVEQMAQKLGISFHGPMGAPKGNNNRKLGELRKEMQRIIQGDC